MSATTAIADDCDLLRRYVAEGSDAAFAEIVRRHVDMIYSTALRRVNGDAALAQDVTQMVFTDFARKARALPDDVVLGGWLHQHTRFTASKAVDKERRRRAREKEAATMNALNHSSADPLWRDVSPLLDNALDRLSSPDRDAIVLRFFERRDLRSVGAALGLSDDTAQKRISRALDKLRAFLARRGVTSTATALSAVITAQAVGAAPAGLAASLPASALAGAATGTGMLAAFSALDRAARLKLAAAAALLAAGCATVIVIQQQRLTVLQQENRQLRIQPAIASTMPVAPAATPSEPARPAEPTPAANPTTLDEIIAKAAGELRGGAQNVSATTSALATLARVTPKQIPEALTMVSRVTDAAAQALLYKYLLGRWAESQPWEALRYSQNELPAQCRPGVFEGILTAWAGKNPESALAWFQKSAGGAPPPIRESLIATLFRGMASQDLAKAFQHYAGLPSDNEREQALRGLLQVVATDDDRQRAMTAIATLDDPDVRLKARRALVEHWAGQNAEAAAAWVEQAEPAWERQRLMDSLGLTWLQSEPQRAADWWVAHAPGSDTLIKIINVWAHNDPNAAGEWLGRQPRGEESDSARMTFARQVADTDAVSAFAWADTITAPAIREATVDHIFQSWHGRDPAAALDYVAKANWPDDRRARVQKLIR